MTLTIEAVYENGVLKPAQPLPLQERETVRVTIEAAHTAVQDPFEEVIGTCDGPPDGAADHDKYLYGESRS